MCSASVADAMAFAAMPDSAHLILKLISKVADTPSGQSLPVTLFSTVKQGLQQCKLLNSEPIADMHDAHGASAL